MKLKIYKMFDDVIVPTYGTQSAACFDVRAYLNPKNVDAVKVWTSMNEVMFAKIETGPNGFPFLELPPHSRALIPTGMIFDIQDGFSLRGHPRSGLSVKHGLTLINAEGVIDSDYVEQTHITLWNTTDLSYFISHEERLAQFEIVPQIRSDFEVITERPQVKTDRTGGFGSTGKQ